MKKLLKIGILSFLFLGAMEAHSINTLKADSTVNMPVTSNTETRVKVLQFRLQQINEMDLNQLDMQQKKALKKEVKEIQKELKTTGNGIYISVGGIIIILLILILIF